MGSSKVSESQVQAQCTALLELDGWRCLATDPPEARGRVAEKGIADNLYIRYGGLNRADALHRAQAEMMWVEWKAPKRSKTSEDQHKWHLLERTRGALTLKAGEDFKPTVEGFLEWYNSSGLAVKQLSLGGKRR